MGRRPITFDEFKKRLGNEVGEEYKIIGEYAGYSNKIKLKHLLCNTEFEPVCSAFISTGTRCPNCAKETYNIDSISLKINNVDSEYNVISEEYLGYEEPIIIFHNTCKQSFNTTPKRFLVNENRCPYCNKGTRYTFEEIEKKLNKRYNRKLSLIDIYINEEKKIKCKCICCNEVFVINMSILNNQYKFSCCKSKIVKLKKKEAYYVNKINNIDKNISKINKEIESINNKIIKHNKFKEQLYMINPEIEMLSLYEKTTEKIKLKHKTCNKIFYSYKKHLLEGKSCPYCNESKGERKIRLYLESKNIKYKREYKFNDCKSKHRLRFDFALFDNNDLIALIEYDGIQHYSSKYNFGEKKIEKYNNIKKRDLIKDKYCKNNNITLIRIPYYKINDIEQILNNCLL